MTDASPEVKAAAEAVAAPINGDAADEGSVAAQIKNEESESTAPAADEKAADPKPADVKEEAKTDDVKPDSNGPATEENPVETEGGKNGDVAVKEEVADLKPQETTEADEKDKDKKNGRRNYINNKKYDASVLPDSDNPVEARDQVEFYFSDSNLPIDKFMWEQTGGAENKPLDLDLILSFRRMRRFKDRDMVVAALRESTELEITGEAGKELVSRKEAWDPATSRGPNHKATLYAKEFGDELPSSQFDIEQFFHSFGDIKSVRLRRDIPNGNIFKGSVWVECASEEELKRILALESKPQWKGNDLTMKSKDDFCDEKLSLIREGKLEASKSGEHKFFAGRTSKPRNGTDDWKNKSSGDRGRGRGRGDGGFRGKGDGGFRGKGDGGFRGNGRGGGRGGGRHNGNFRGGRGGRGRGGGRGGRGGHRDRDSAKPQNGKPQNGNDGMPVIQSSAPAENKKRQRDDAAPAGEPAAKKVATSST